MLPNLFKVCIYLLNEIFISHPLFLLIASGDVAISSSNENVDE